jgi:hypothetical protein
MFQPLDMFYDINNKKFTKKFDKILKRIIFIKKIEEKDKFKEEEFLLSIKKDIRKRESLNKMLKEFGYDDNLNLKVKEKCNGVINLLEKKEKLILSDFGIDILKKYFKIFKNDNDKNIKNILNVFSFFDEEEYNLMEESLKNYTIYYSDEFDEDIFILLFNLITFISPDKMIETLIYWGYSENENLKKILKIEKKNDKSKKILVCYLFGNKINYNFLGSEGSGKSR